MAAFLDFLFIYLFYLYLLNFFFANLISIVRPFRHRSCSFKDNLAKIYMRQINTKYKFNSMSSLRK